VKEQKVWEGAKFQGLCEGGDCVQDPIDKKEDRGTLLQLIVTLGPKRKRKERGHSLQGEVIIMKERVLSSYGICHSLSNKCTETLCPPGKKGKS